MSDSLDDLERAAKAAIKVAPGEWGEDGYNERDGGASYRQSTVVAKLRASGPDEYGVIVDTFNADFILDPDQRFDIGNYIALANPEAILSLIARLRSAEAALGPFRRLGESGERVLREDERDGAEVRVSLTYESVRAAAAHFASFKPES